MAAACAVLFQIGSTPQIALATSVLFLVPGVQMLNSIMDLMHGHILMGISRGVHSIMMIVCIAIRCVEETGSYRPVSGRKKKNNPQPKRTESFFDYLPAEETSSICRRENRYFP